MVQQTNKEKKIYLVADHAQINIEILYIEITWTILVHDKGNQ